MQVTEEGTTAAAATGAVMMTRSAAVLPNRLIADHPFSYVIANKDSHVLFGGVHNGSD